jgi:hypothetical protein
MRLRLRTEKEMERGTAERGGAESRFGKVIDSIPHSYFVTNSLRKEFKSIND